MSAQEILAEISKLSPEERQEVKDGLDGGHEPVTNGPESTEGDSGKSPGANSAEHREIPVGLRGFKKSAATSLEELAKAEGIKEEDVWDVLARYAGTFDGLPEDMAVNHDHYLYGTPKQKP